VRWVNSNSTSADRERDGTMLFTDLAQALADVPPDRLAGVIMITDGEVHDVPASAASLGFEAPVHALLFACIHRAGHANAPYYVNGIAHLGGDRLIWLYDIHLLVVSMSADELVEFAELAASKEIKAICLAALRRTGECFATPIPADVAEMLNGAGCIEASARYLSGGRARQMLGDFLAFDRWSDRAAWVKEHAFPSADYMHSKYPDARDTWLPVLYARRALTGVARLTFSRDAGHGH